MIKKIIVRCFAAVALFVFLVVTSVGVCFWLANQTPGYYAKLQQQDFTIGEIESIHDRLKEASNSIEQWAFEKAQQADDAGEIQIKEFELNQDELNASLSSEGFSAGQLRNPRVLILDDRVRLGAELSLGNDWPIVLSADLRVSRSSGNKLKLDFVGAQIGNLPLPMHWILHSLPPEMFDSKKEFEFCLSDPVPHVKVDLANSPKNAPVLKDIKIVRGRMTLNWAPPTVAF